MHEQLLSPHPPPHPPKKEPPLQQESKRMIRIMLLHPPDSPHSHPHPLLQFVAAKSLIYKSPLGGYIVYYASMLVYVAYFFKKCFVKEKRRNYNYVCTK